MEISLLYLKHNVPGGSGKNEPEQVGRSQILRGLEGLACISEGSLSAVVCRKNQKG